MNNDGKTLENLLIENQELGAAIFIVALFIMIYLLREKEKSNIDHSSNPATKPLAIFNKLVIIGVYVYFLNISKKAHENSTSKADFIGYIAAIIAAIPPIVLLFAFFVAMNEEDVKNPLL